MALGGFVFLIGSSVQCGSTRNSASDIDMAMPPPDLAAAPDLMPYAPPLITSINPTRKIDIAPDPLTITGSGFLSGATVTVGGTPCTNVVVESPSKITCSAPQKFRTCAAQSVAVTNPDQQLAKSPVDIIYYSYLTTFAPANPATVNPGNKPRRIINGDFNGDQKGDLVTTFFANDNIGVLIGNGDGTFKSPTLLSTAGVTGVVSVATADLNSDQKLDLMVIYSTPSSYTVHLGNGDGTFKAGVNTNAGVTKPLAVVLGDVNGDSKPDLVMGSTQAVVGLALGNGDGTFKTMTTLTTSGSSDGVLIADFNNDKLADVATASGSAFTGDLLLGNGDGTFQGTRRVSPPISPPIGIAAARLNGGPQLDLLFATQGTSSITVLPGTGTGSFQSPRTVTVGATPLALVVTDMNGDGYPDLVTANAGNSWSFGQGTITNYFAIPVTTTFGSSPQDVTVGDFNGDKLLDVAVTSSMANEVGIFLQQCPQ